MITYLRCDPLYPFTCENQAQVNQIQYGKKPPVYNISFSCWGSHTQQSASKHLNDIMELQMILLHRLNKPHSIGL